MRKEFSEFAKTHLKQDLNSIVLLGDISVGLFVDQTDQLPNRVINLGIAEQSMISFAAGLSREGIVPFVHTISPFIIERAFEQIKLDFCYNKTKCILVSANGPYDYNKLGPTHHCAGDIPLVSSLPNINFALPGKASDVANILRWAIAQEASTYIRLAASANNETHLVAGTVDRAENASVRLDILVGESIGEYKDAQPDKGSDVLYVWGAHQIWASNLSCYDEIHIWEPYSTGVLAMELCARLDSKIKILSYCYPKSIEHGIYVKPPYECRRLR